ncbi:MAG TPA: hypothetical protein VG388_12830 [Solirubrobacteraceae bacterium]|jgi:hypothetical protein|nr:hypothetical protein [Solirubrobacteraceae bacterium]
MATDPEQSIVPPSEMRGGTTPDAEESARKGDWAGQAGKGIVPPEQGGADAPREMLAEDPELESSVLGQTTGSDEPATESGIDLSAGDNADATSHGGPNLPDEPGVEPDMKDGAAKPVREIDLNDAPA